MASRAQRRASRRKHNQALRSAGPQPIATTADRRSDHVSAAEDAPYAAKRMANRKAPLDDLYERGSISEDQHVAGSRYAQDWYRGTQPASITAQYERSPKGHQDQEPIDQVEAYSRYRYVTNRLVPEQWDVARHVCCDELGTRAWDADHSRRQGSCTLILRLALDRIAMLQAEWWAVVGRGT